MTPLPLAVPAMLTLRRILFPTDYAPCADRAFAHAAFLAARHGAELHVFHARPVTGTEPGPAHAYDVPEEVHHVDVTVQALSVPEAIVGHARDADLVVMGTHGRRGVRRLAVGSTTEHVLRHADCPVLAVGAEAKRTAPAAVERVLVPVDFSASSGPALAVADALAALYGAHVDALHAAYVPTLPDVYEIGLHVETVYPDIISRSEDALDALARRFVAADRLGEVAVRIGPPGATILAEADRLEAGLLVMPTHGRTGLDRLAFGSVAEQVLRRAPCPVFAIPSFGRIPLPEEVARPVATPRPELADALANHDV